jgi:Ferritin-like
MLHLALATNILTAVGAAPHFERPNMPILSRWYPPGVQIALLPFGERALRHFMYLERPEGMTLADAGGFAAVADIPPLAHLDRPTVAVPEQWQTVGHLYRGIEAGLARLCGRHGEEAVFIGSAAAQAVTATFEWKELTRCHPRFDVLTETCGALAHEPGLAVLGDLAAKLRSMTRDIRTHLDERAASPPSGPV